MYDTKIRLSLSETLNPAKWTMKLLESDNHSITVEVSIPPNAIIGRYVISDRYPHVGTWPMAAW